MVGLDQLVLKFAHRVLVWDLFHLPKERLDLLHCFLLWRKVVRCIGSPFKENTNQFDIRIGWKDYIVPFCIILKMKKFSYRFWTIFTCQRVFIQFNASKWSNTHLNWKKLSVVRYTEDKCEGEDLGKRPHCSKKKEISNRNFQRKRKFSLNYFSCHSIIIKNSWHEKRRYWLDESWPNS